ncbi:hypothetical protein ACGF1Z_31095 [Streptomyces sp. NPDC048018]|uniref:hypothetical protein n=1 Tax=Streptomyces sp. NPDC048018 TaxID=3365499 RepID=UPI003723E70A
MPIVVPLLESKQYTGSNGPAIVEWLCGTIDLESDDGEELVLNYIGSPRRLRVGDWVIAGGGGAGTPRCFSTETTAADYANVWAELPGL